MLKLSILDQTPIPIGMSPKEVLKESLQLAQLADDLGYYRYWLSEHHHTEGIASASPEILASHIAALTSRIRVGSGGVLLSHYSPLKVVENFRLLEALYPSRIDLGIGRAPGGDPRTRLALADGIPRSKEAFPRQIQDLLSYLSNQDPVDPQLAGVKAIPNMESRPEVWLLGSSTSSATYAADFGTAFSFAHFINSNDGPSVVKDYRARFRPSTFSPAPQVSVCVYVVCAETDEAAAREAQSLEYWLIKTAEGQADGVPTVEQAEAFVPDPRQLIALQENRRKMIVGSPQTVKAGLEYMAHDYQADEIMLITNIHSPSARRRSFQLIAEAFGLKGSHQSGTRTIRIKKPETI